MLIIGLLHGKRQKSAIAGHVISGYPRGVTRGLLSGTGVTRNAGYATQQGPTVALVFRA